MATDPTVTVLTAVRNGARFLPETIDSIRAQTFADWEYIIVDDASTDDTPDVVRVYEQRDPRIRLLRLESGGGPYAAANRGLSEARGRYVARIDSDDLALPNRLDLQLRYLQANSGLRACAAFWQVISAEGHVDPQVRKIPISPAVIPWFLCVKGGFVHSSAFIERAAFEEIGWYRERPVSQDYRMWCELSQKRRLGVLPEVIVQWRSHESSISAYSHENQVSAHVEILQEHLARLTGERWTRPDAQALYRVSRAREISVLGGLDVLDRWQRSWRHSGGLVPSDRRELATLGLRIRLRHLKWNWKSDPSRLPVGLMRTVLATRG